MYSLHTGRFLVPPFVSPYPALGASINDVLIILGFLDPFPLCPHLELICTLGSTQPLFHDSSPLSDEDIISGSSITMPNLPQSSTQKPGKNITPNRRSEMSTFNSLLGIVTVACAPLNHELSGETSNLLWRLYPRLLSNLQINLFSPHHNT